MNMMIEENNRVEKEIQLSLDTYKTEYWDKMMRGIRPAEDKLVAGKTKNGMFQLPMDSSREYQAALMKESFFRNIATCVDAPRFDNDIWISDNSINAEWAREGELLSITRMEDDFERMEVHCNKLVALTTLNNDLATDIGFNVKKCLISRFAEGFNREEENAFINGNGDAMPIGILHDTALALRKLKDADGNYIWNHNTDTILGKPVYISEFMPSSESGKKPIAFGDFSYYWIVNRSGIAVRTLGEKYALEHMTGYLAQEFLDARLIRPEAIKVIEMV